MQNVDFINTLPSDTVLEHLTLWDAAVSSYNWFLTFRKFFIPFFGGEGWVALPLKIKEQ